MAVPLINGQAYAYADIVVNILGVPLAGITAIEYTDKQEITENYGAGRYPVSRGFGKIECSGKITIDMAEKQAILARATGRRLQAIPEFEIVVTYLPENGTPVQETLKNCRFKDNKGGGAEGDSTLNTELELAISHIVW